MVSQAGPSWPSARSRRRRSGIARHEAGASLIAAEERLGVGFGSWLSMPAPGSSAGVVNGE